MEIDKIVEMVKARLELSESKHIPIEASGRHVHLSLEDAEALFGKNYEFNAVKELSQHGQFAYKERVRLIGPKGVIEGVIILGPYRKTTQVEISVTDSRVLGIKPELRESGDTSGTPGILVSNGGNFVTLKEGVIVAKNHIHMSVNDAEVLNLKDKDLVKVQVHSKRPVIFEDVLVRVNENFSLSMHVDYDEGNACMLEKDSYGVIYE
ncbi:MAG: phosphate propanoyltransferase [Cetobacterium sp.]